MKKFKWRVAAILLSLCSVGGVRAEGFFFTVRGVSDNLWSSTMIDAGEALVSVLSGGRVGVEGGYTVDVFNLKDNGQKVDVVGPKYWSFKARDMFGYMEFGTKIGWHGPYSPIGVYGQCYYNMRNQKMRFLHDENYGRYKTNMVKIGAGIRVVPWFNDEGSLFLEAGSTYNMVTTCQTPYGKDKSQFNNGASTDFAVGYTWLGDINTTLTLGSNINHYNYFNKKYTNDDGLYYPFANTKSTSFTIYIRVASYFTAW